MPKSKSSSILDLSNKILHTKIKIRDLTGSIITLNPVKMLSISRSMLTKNIETQAINYYTLMRAVNRVSLDQRAVLQAVKWMHGHLYNKYVQDSVLIRENGGRKPTDAMVRSAISNNPKYFEAVKSYNKVNYYYQDLLALSKAMQMRKDLIQTYSAQIRQEYNTGENTTKA